jgi:hypothetical protein
VTPIWRWSAAPFEEEEDPVAEAVDEAPEDPPPLLPPVVLPALFVATEPLEDVGAILAVRK